MQRMLAVGCLVLLVVLSSVAVAVVFSRPELAGPVGVLVAVIDLSVQLARSRRR